MTTAPIAASIVLPTYNRAWGLEPALRSVLAQTEPSFEVIVMDDASTDDTAKVAAAFVDPRVRYHRQPVNAGMVATGETGFVWLGVSL